MAHVTGAGVRRVVLVAIATLEFAAGGAALWLARSRSLPLLPLRTERLVAYAWVALTIGAACGAYALARRAARAAGTRVRGELVAAALADVSALAGIAAFVLLRVWPVLVVSLVVGLFGLVLGWPSATPPAGVSAPATPVTKTSG